MAKKVQEEITPTSAETILNMTRAVEPEIPDRRGPMVHDLTFTPSLNGIDPNYQKKPGVY